MAWSDLLLYRIWRIPEKYEANTLKDYFGRYLQTGEHIRIDETRSMSFISCNDNGFYFIEYGSDDNTDRYTRLRYYTFEDFVNYLSPLDKNCGTTRSIKAQTDDFTGP